jgi:hypothetical protein
MKMKSTVKIIVDIVMTVILVSLFFAEDTGLAFHEIIGLSVFFVICLHLILNRKWITSTTKNLIGKKTGNKTKPKTAWTYVLNAALLIGFIVIIATGIMISAVVFPQEGRSPIVSHIHEIAAYLTGGLLILHIVLHLKYLRSSIKNIFKNFKTPIARRAFSGAFSILVVLGILYYNIISTLNKNLYADSLDQIKAQAAQISSDQLTPISLSEFLGNMFCTACSNHCPLSNPQCGKSSNLIKAATAEYQILYNNGDPLAADGTSDNSTSSNSPSDQPATKRDEQRKQREYRDRESSRGRESDHYRESDHDRESGHDRESYHR